MQELRASLERLDKSGIHVIGCIVNATQSLEELIASRKKPAKKQKKGAKVERPRPAIQLDELMPELPLTDLEPPAPPEAEEEAAGPDAPAEELELETPQENSLYSESLPSDGEAIQSADDFLDLLRQMQSEERKQEEE